MSVKFREHFFFKYILSKRNYLVFYIKKLYYITYYIFEFPLYTAKHESIVKKKKQ